ncbi:hypothetical protein PV325_002679 [Microctonus aethiopoides]|uniref:ferroxidase n=1 Tax=Microctonus aethiopoides TaxID=144406 RepID=A0AA39KJM5_9HYME|nr:hypothetical protein PV325_002679 [Microctonus aethiopoides]KAK0163781.1 hypothetical protein PV328_002476 [Microctonus aethiopoides]
MLSVTTKIGRCRILSKFSFIIINKFKYSCQLSSLRGYVVENSTRNNKYINKIDNRFCHATIVQYSSEENSIKSSQQELDDLQYDIITNDTLDSLTEYFDNIIEKADHLNEADVTYGSGVLTVKFGSKYGTYVINRQTPNKQIWLSSPTSGPKRYDFINGTWIYKHDGKSLHELLDKEIPSIVKDTTSFNKCAYGRRIK